MPGFLGLQRFFGGTVSNTAAYSAGGAIQRVLHPQLQSLANEGWQLHPDYPIDAGTLANGVAQGQVPYEWARDEARRTGFNTERFDRLVDVADTGPGVPVAFDLWRRGELDEAGFRRAAKRQGLEAEWINALVRIKLDVLDQGQLAAAIHRGLIPDPGLLEGELPSGEGNVPAYPVYNIDALAEALANGYDRDHLGVLVGLQGLPMGSHEAAQARFRQILTDDDYLRAIAEGNTRNEWARAILEQSRQIPTSHTYVEGRLRGWLTDAEMNAGTARHGMTPEDTHLDFLVSGRPPSWHQVWIGLQRGGVYDGPIGDIDPAFLKSLQESNLRPEWYNLLWHSRYNYPAPFVLRALAQGNDLTEAETEEILKFEGWEPTLRKKVAKRWAAAQAAAQKEASAADLLALYDGDKATHAETLAALEALDYPADEAQRKIDVLDSRRVASAKQAAIGDLHTKYKKGELPEANVATALRALGVAEWAVPEIISKWRAFLTAEAEAAPAQLAPHLTGFTPTSGPVGTTVTLTGTNLQGTSAVSIGGTAAQFTATSPTVVSATVPAGATSGQWSLRTPGGAAASDASFLVT